MTQDRPSVQRPASEIILYQTEDGVSRIEVSLTEGTVWLSQALMAELYQTTKQNVSLHIRNILSEGELAVQRKVGSSDQGAWIDNSCQDKGLDFWQEYGHGCQSDSQGGAGFASVFG